MATRNRASLLGRCLDALLKQDYPRHLTEIVVVDDGSTDETATLLRTVATSEPRIKILHQARKWQAAARNAGITASTGDLIVVTDDDCTPAQNWLSSVSKEYASTDYDALAGRVRAPGVTLLTRYLDYTRELNPKILPSGAPTHLVTANASFRRRVINQIGVFDTRFGPSGGEDTEFTLRMRKAGLRVGFYDSARVDHWYDSDLKQFLRRAYRYGCGTRMAVCKYPGSELTITDAQSALSRTLSGTARVRHFTEIDQSNVRYWFRILHTLRSACYLAGYTGAAPFNESADAAKVEEKSTQHFLSEVADAAHELVIDPPAQSLRLSPDFQSCECESLALDLNSLLSWANTNELGLNHLPAEVDAVSHKKSTRGREELEARFIEAERQLLADGKANHSVEEVESVCRDKNIDVNAFFEWRERRPVSPTAGIFRRKRRKHHENDWPWSPSY